MVYYSEDLYSPADVSVSITNMRVSRGLLTILVGLSLTLVCQGHDTATRHTGPHLSLLGENNVGHEQHATADAAPRFTDHSDHAIVDQHSDLTSAYSSPLNLQQDVAATGPTLNSAHGTESSSMQVAIIFAALSVLLRRYHVASRGQPLAGSVALAPPDHPPPRSFSPSPAV